MEINEEKLKRILEKQRKEYQEYIGILSEDFRAQTKLIAEAQADLQKQLVVIRETIAKITETITDLQVQVVAIKEMVAKNTEDIEAMKIEMIAMKKDMIAMKKDIEIMKADISTIKYELKRKVSWDEFEALEKRVLILEKEKKPKRTQRFSNQG